MYFLLDVLVKKFKSGKCKKKIELSPRQYLKKILTISEMVIS